MENYKIKNIFLGKTIQAHVCDIQALGLNSRGQNDWSRMSYSMVQTNPNSDFILKATYPHCGKLCLTFGPNFEGLGTKRKVGRKKKR
jgi:hypothetical protein